MATRFFQLHKLACCRLSYSFSGQRLIFPQLYRKLLQRFETINVCKTSYSSRSNIANHSKLSDEPLLVSPLCANMFGNLTGNNATRKDRQLCSDCRSIDRKSLRYINRLFVKHDIQADSFSHSNLLTKRLMSTEGFRERNKSILLYISALGVIMLGMAYAGVPLYRMFCQTTGRGGQATRGHDTSKVENMVPIKDRVIHVMFNADTGSSMQWNFKPQQTEVKVLPGETALAFYSALNPTDRPIIGISTYNVIPFEAGQYFNKIQCFCFEEQMLNPHEEVDMPVFFFIDPDFAEDPRMENVDTITLSYTFFESKEGMTLQVPVYAKQAESKESVRATDSSPAVDKTETVSVDEAVDNSKTAQRVSAGERISNVI